MATGQVKTTAELFGEKDEEESKTTAELFGKPEAVSVQPKKTKEISTTLAPEPKKGHPWYSLHNSLELLYSAAGGIAGSYAHKYRLLEKANKFIVDKTLKYFKLYGISLDELGVSRKKLTGGLWTILAKDAEKLRDTFYAKGAPGFFGEVMKGLGGAVPEIASIMALGGYGLAVHGAAVGGIEEGTVKGAAVGAARGALTHGILKGIGILPSIVRPGAFAGFGAITEPGGVKEKAAGALTWTVLGLSGGNKRVKIGEFLRAYPAVQTMLDEGRATRILKKLSPKTTKKQIKEAGGAKAVLDDVVNELRKMPEEKTTKDLKIQRELPESKAIIEREMEEAPSIEKIKQEGTTKGIVGKPLQELPRKVVNKIIDTFQVEPQFKQIKAPETGLAFKTFHEKINGELEKSKIKIREVSKENLSSHEFQELTFVASQLKKLQSLPLEKRKRISPAYKKVRSFFDTYAKELKKRGIITREFPESTIHKLNEQIKTEQKSLREGKFEGAKVIEAQESVKEMKIARDFLKKSKYVHIPKAWMEAMWADRETDAPALISQFFKERKTYDIERLAKWLIDKGEIKPRDTDIRIIMAQYAHTTSKKLALADIFNAAQKEKLVARSEKAPLDWQHVDNEVFPTFRGKMVHPVFADYLEKNLIRRKFLPPKMGYVLGTIKLLQFYNPVFLPMYDTVQAWWAGSIRSKKTPQLFGRAFKSMFKKDAAYWNMHYWGGFSTPYSPTWTSFTKDVQREIDSNPFMRSIKKYVSNPYRLSWELAWGGDHLIRLLTYHHYKEKGLSSKDAAQVTARLHADYASIPPATRQRLNWVFFTPSFKISMMAAQMEMVKGAGTYLTSAAKITKPQEAREKAMAKALVGLASGMLLRNFIMKKLGFEQDQWGLKYYKKIMTEKGAEEIVLHAASPDNVFLRFFHRFKNLPLDAQIIGNLFNRAKWELHPVWQLGHEIIANKSVTFEPVYNKFDPAWKISRDIGLYTVTRILRFTEQIKGMGISEKRLEAQRLLSKDLGTPVASVLKWFTLPYVRSVKARRVQYQMNRLIRTFIQLNKEKPAKSPREQLERQEKLNRKLKKLQNSLRKIE